MDNKNELRDTDGWLLCVEAARTPSRRGLVLLGVWYECGYLTPETARAYAAELIRVADLAERIGAEG